MNIDIGLAVVLLAVLIFYLRLIILQRERARRSRQVMNRIEKEQKRSGTSRRPLGAAFSILSKNWVDHAIAAIGVLAMVVGVLLNAHLIAGPAVQTYWWLPTALGIVAFSWAFKL